MPGAYAIPPAWIFLKKRSGKRYGAHVFRITGCSDPASISTNDSKRDDHLKSADFFDVENFKEISFQGNTYEKVDKGNDYYLYGDLTIKGVTKQVKLYVEFNGIVKDPWGNEKAVFNIEGRINRKEWGLNWNAALEAGGVLVGEDVFIDIGVQLAKQAEMQE